MKNERRGTQPRFVVDAGEEGKRGGRGPGERGEATAPQAHSPRRRRHAIPLSLQVSAARTAARIEEIKLYLLWDAIGR